LGTLFSYSPLTIFFYAALKDVYKANPLETIPIAIIDESENAASFTSFQEMLDKY
jgi:hypothetical protein